MPALPKPLRSELEKVISDHARPTAEAGALEALRAMAVDQKEPFSHLSPAEKSLRLRLRAHGRALGDRRDAVRQTQALGNLAHAVAYEHWHRMLFTRFLAENDCLLEPVHRVAVPLFGQDSVEEIARELGVSVWDLAGQFAEKMLPQIFRSDDPALVLKLPAETRVKLEGFLARLPAQVFTADDSLGWVYQFWQSDAKELANKAGDKIDAATLPSVTQLFTEDYMVDFMLHNTLGAWHAGKQGIDRQSSIGSEEAARAAVALPAIDGLPAYEWSYLRFLAPGADDSAGWRPAAGTYETWPRTAAELTLLDPSMGSGHFLAAALPVMARLRMAEENLSREDAVIAVLRDNLHGLELDPRCAQLAGFNLALAAWKFARGLLTSNRALPPLHLACCGQAPVGTREEWLQVLEGRGNTELRFFLAQLYDVFQQAPLLGSLIQPRRVLGGIFNPKRLDELFAVVDAALSESHPNLGDRYETGVVVQGIAKAVQLLAKAFTLVLTNVPYLARGKQADKLRDFIEEKFPNGKSDLATAFVLRCLDFCAQGGTTTLVTPQNWLFLKSYQKLREELLSNVTWDWVARLGPKGFQTPMWDFNVMLFSLSRHEPPSDQILAGIDVAEQTNAADKAELLRDGELHVVSQAAQLENPDARVALEETSGPLLAALASNHQGLSTGDNPRFRRISGEVQQWGNQWIGEQSTVSATTHFGGCEGILLWEEGKGSLYRFGRENVEALHNVDRRGEEAWGGQGILVSQMGSLPVTRYLGAQFDTNAAVLLPRNSTQLPAMWVFCADHGYAETVRKIDQKLNVTNGTLSKVPFDLAHWTAVANERYPSDLPEPYSPDPTQWLFRGRVDDATEPLQVAVARLLGYRWPAETDPEKAGVEVFESDRAFWNGIASLADADGIVCLTPLRGEPAAASRLDAMLRRAWELGREHPYQLPANWRDDEIPTAPRALDFATPDAWISHLLSRASVRDLEAYLRDAFFEEHCKVFQHRPFLWHIWDGRPDGFHALVNYHRLAAPHGQGRKLLETLNFSYLGDWIRRQKDDVAQGKPGAQDRLDAAELLQGELNAILAGEPPYDLFIRWKPLHQQPIGWEPDINDGVRLNLRPFLLAKDVKKKGAGLLRFKPNVNWNKDRGKEPLRLQEDYPWFWSWDEKTVDFKGTCQPDGNRWNDCHYTTSFKRQARERRSS